MIKTLVPLLFSTVVFGVMPEPVTAETIRRACLASDRGDDQPQLCRCLQGAADRTLSNRDQRQAAKFFRDPEEAERVRRSDTRRNEAFWDRYKAFGDTARRFCAS